MSTRRARRTDLREGSLDVSNLFVNPQLDASGKIILPADLDAQEWVFIQPSFANLNSQPSFPTQSGAGLTNFYSFTLGSTVALDDSSVTLIKVYINGIKLSLANIEITNLTCYIGLPYALDASDSIEISYVEAV